MSGDGGEDAEDTAEKRHRSSFGDLEEALGSKPEPTSSTTVEPADDGAQREESYFSDLLTELGGEAEDGSWDEVDDDDLEWGGAGGGGIISDSKSQAILELLRGAQNVLLLGPLLCPADYEIGTTLMEGEDDEPFNLLLVTFSQSPDERLNVCRSYLDSVPGEIRILGIGSQRGTGSGGSIETPDGKVSVSTVSNPADLKRIGIKINQALNDWDSAGRRSVLCFHSLTALLQYVDDERRIFRFLSILRGRIQKSDGHAHYHMEPAAHDESVIETIRSLFDAIITYDEDGSVSIDN